MIKFAENLKDFENIDDLIEDPLNAKIHTEKQISQLAKTIKKYGFSDPVVICKDKRVHAGHCRLSALKLLGETKAPVVVMDFKSEAEARAFALAHNSINMETGFDKQRVLENFEIIKQDEIEFTNFQEIDFQVLEPQTIDAVNMAIDNPEAFYERINENKQQVFSNKNQEIDIDNIDTSECKIIFKFDALMYETILNKINNLKQEKDIKTNELLLLDLLENA